MPHAARRLLPAATIAGLLFLLAQAAFLMVHANSDARLFQFTPYSGQTAFRLNVTIGDQAQTIAQIRERYDLPFHGYTDLTPKALQKIVIHHESHRPPGSEVYVRMHFSRRGGPEEIWLWPQQ